MLAYLKKNLSGSVWRQGKYSRRECFLLLLFLNKVSQVLHLVGRHRLIFQVCLGKADSSPWTVLEMPGFECEPFSTSLMSLWIPTLAECVRMCKMKHGDPPLAAQSMLMEQDWRHQQGLRMHPTCIEILGAMMIAETWMTPLPTSIATTNGCNGIVLPCVFAPVLRCAWLILGSFFFSHREGKSSSLPEHGSFLLPSGMDLNSSAWE